MWMVNLFKGWGVPMFLGSVPWAILSSWLGYKIAYNYVVKHREKRVGAHAWSVTSLQSSIQKPPSSKSSSKIIGGTISWSAAHQMCLYPAVLWPAIRHQFALALAHLT